MTGDAQLKEAMKCKPHLDHGSRGLSQQKDVTRLRNVASSPIAITPIGCGHRGIPHDFSKIGGWSASQWNLSNQQSVLARKKQIERKNGRLVNSRDWDTTSYVCGHTAHQNIYGIEVQAGS